MKPLFRITAIALVALYCTHVSAQTFPAIVTDVTAGDIYKIDRKGKEQLVVLYGVTSLGIKGSARQAKDFATQRVLNQHVTVRIVEKRAGMTLVEITLADKSNLAHLMLQNGLLKWDSFTARDDQTLRDLENTARQEKRGIWGAGGAPAAKTSGPAPAQPKAGPSGERQYERRFNAGYDILEGRAFTDEKGVPNLILRGNGEKIEGFEAEVEQQAAEENAAIIAAEEERMRADAAARAEADRVAYEQQLAAQQEAARQMQMENLNMINQQLFFGRNFGVASQPTFLTPRPINY